MQMSIKKFRRAHLEEAVKICGTAEVLADRAGMNPQYLSMLRRGSREVGHKSARSVEGAVGWAEGAMDLAPRGAPTDAELDYLLKSVD